MIAFIKRHWNAKRTEFWLAELRERHESMKLIQQLADREIARYQKMFNEQCDGGIYRELRQENVNLRRAEISLTTERDSLRRENDGFKANIKELFAGLELIAGKLDEMAGLEREAKRIRAEDAAGVESES